MKRMLTLCGVGLLALAGCTKTSDSADKEKVRIGWVFALANAPVVIAQHNGYFAKENLEAEVIPFESGPLVHQAIAAKQIDVAYIGIPPVYHWWSQGLKGRIVAKVNYGQAAVIASKKSGITSLEGLRGKKLAGVRKGSGMDVLLNGFVLRDTAKLDPDKDLEITSMPSANMGPAVEAGVVDAAFTWEPFTTQYELRGNVNVIFDVAQALPHYPWYVVMSAPEFLESKRDVVVRVVRAHQQAVDFLNTSADAGAEILAKEFKLEEIVDAAGTRYAATEVVKRARTRLGWEWDLTPQDLQYVQRFMDYSHRMGFIEKPLKAEDVVDVSLLKSLVAAR